MCHELYIQRATNSIPPRYLQLVPAAAFSSSTAPQLFPNCVAQTLDSVSNKLYIVSHELNITSLPSTTLTTTCRYFHSSADTQLSLNYVPWPLYSVGHELYIVRNELNLTSCFQSPCRVPAAASPAALPLSPAPSALQLALFAEPPPTLWSVSQQIMSHI